MKKRSIIAGALGAVLLGLFANPLIGHAKIANDQAFEGANWELVKEDDLEAGIIQSMCVTKDYVVCIENTDDTPENPDVLKAYYRNDTDPEGNPVEKYSLAKRIDTIHYEHCNGMAYNPNTNEIAVSLYTNAVPENRGSVYILDGDTCEYVRTVKVSDDYNILGIGYDTENDRYVIQTNFEGEYSFKILNQNFEVVEDLGEYADTALGDNFQDLCVSGDYIINLPLTLFLDIGDYVHMYSISRREMVSSTPMDFRFENVTWDEPESLCEIAPGVFLVVVNVNTDDGGRKMRWYQASIPYEFQVEVTTKAEDGETKQESLSVLRGNETPLSYPEKEGYNLSEVSVDGKPINIEKYTQKYTLSDIQGDHQVQISYVKKGLNFLLAGGVALIVAVIFGLGTIQVIQIRKVRQRKLQRVRRRRQRLNEEYAM